MVQYKLTYFNIKARGELPRLLFTLAGVEFEDVRVERADWPALKSKAPFGQIPTLEVDGVVLCQSIAISRFLARRFGLAGKSEMDQFRADMIVDCITDMQGPVVAIFRESDPARKAELQKKAEEETYPLLMGKLEKILCDNKGGDGYFVGDELTWADVAFADFYSWIAAQKANHIEKTPKLKALRQRVLSNPKIAAWQAKYPDTQ